MLLPYLTSKITCVPPLKYQDSIGYVLTLPSWCTLALEDIPDFWYRPRPEHHPWLIQILQKMDWTYCTFLYIQTWDILHQPLGLACFWNSYISVLGGPAQCRCPWFPAFFASEFLLSVYSAHPWILFICTWIHQLMFTPTLESYSYACDDIECAHVPLHTHAKTLSFIFLLSVCRMYFSPSVAASAHL